MVEARSALPPEYLPNSRERVAVVLEDAAGEWRRSGDARELRRALHALLLELDSVE